jgi:hypothetical protein
VKEAAIHGLEFESFILMINENKFIKPSGTGNQKSEALKAPLSAKDSELLGTERTSDAQQTAATGKRPHHAKSQASGGEQKRRSK